jgi:methionyl-tRNA formyltransferase
VAISVSISGEPARVDINIPFKAIERVVRALSPQPPPT